MGRVLPATSLLVLIPSFGELFSDSSHAIYITLLSYEVEFYHSNFHIIDMH